MAKKSEQDAADEQGKYGITVAAGLSGLKEQTLRLYERKGVLTPSRTAGGTRRYSDNDVTALKRAVELIADGLNLAGVRRVIELEAVNQRLRRRIAELTKARP